MSIRYLDQNGAVSFWTNIKNYILSKIPTKTSELTNDSGFLTQHQSLSNYVTLNSEQTITGKKLFTNATTQVNSVNTFIGSTLFIDTSASVPRGSFPETAYRVGRVYIGDNLTYNDAWFIVDPIIDTDKAYYRMVTTNPDNTDSTRFIIEWNSNYEGARRRRNISLGDLLPYTTNTYNLGESGNVWQDAYINKIHGISDYTNLKTNSFNVNTTLTHGGSGRRVILAMGAITLTVPAPEEGSWFLIKAVNGLVTLNLASNVTVTGITAGAFSGPIYLQPNESILLCYYSSTTYNATISTIRRSGVVGRTGNVPSENPKHWFKIAENYVTATYRDPFICLTVFESTTGNTIGTLCAHCRINNTVGVVDTYTCYLQWQDAGSGIDLSKYALTTNETSGTGVTISLWCQLTGGYASLKFEVVSECGQSDQLGNPEWVLTRRRQADGDLAELLDTDFTKIVYSTLTTLKNDTTGKASNVTGTVAIANGGTGATTRLNAVKALTNEAVASPTHFLTMTTNWGKAGYTTVAQAKTVLGITGDMGSHSDSEYVHKTGDETIGGSKTFSSTITGSISGNAGTATQFSANKSVTLTGDVTGTASSKAGWSVSTTLSNSGVTAGTYGPSEDVAGNNNATISVPEITVDSKGRVTSVTNRTLTCKNNTYNVYNKTLTIQKNGTNVATFTSNSNTDVTANITVPTKTSELTNDSNFLTTSSSLNASKLTGTIDIARLPQGALERVITVANQTARFALTTSSVQLGDTVKQLDTGVMYVVVNESKLNSNDGYLEYTAGSASSVPWSGITSKPTEFTPSSHTHTKSEITDFPTNVSAFTNDAGYLTSHQSLSNYVTLNTAQEITNAKTFKDANTVRKLTSVEAGNVIPTSDKLISDIWQDKNGKELGRIYYVKSKSGTTELIMRAGDWFTSNDGVYTLDASGTNRRAELHLYTDSSGNCCIKPVGYFSTTLKPLNSSVLLGEYGNSFGSVYAGQFRMSNPSLLPDVDVSANEEHSIGFFGKNNTPLSYITFQKRTNLKDRIAIRVQTSSSEYKSYDFDATCFYPESSNSVDIGSTTNIFKNIYCNNYYKGTTAFGDIVTHNASEFLTSHQSLSNYVTLNTAQSISGIKTFPTNINLANTSTSQIEYWALKFSKTDTNGTGASQIGVYQPSNSNDFVATMRLGNPRGDNKPTTGTGVNTGNCWSGIGVYYNYALNRGYPYAPSCNSWGDSSNADAELASTAWVRRYCETTKGFLTSHQSLANYVTTNTNQTISGNKTFGNGTLIVDNSTGSNVHGEIKFNGSRSGYIVADSSNDGVFDNTNCGISILLQDSGKPLHVGSYKVDSNGRVFADNTNKNPVLTVRGNSIGSSILIPENDTSDNAFRIISELTYANGNPSKTLNVVFRQYDDANATSAIYSNTDNVTSLGISNRRWSKIYGSEYYYGSNNVEFSTKFVTTDTNQTIAGIKSFSDNTYITSLNFTNEVESQSSSSSAVFPIVTTVTYADQSPSQSARLNFRITANGDKSLYPHENNQYSLGLSTRSFSDFYSYHGYFRGQQQGDEYSPNARTNLTLIANRDTLGQSGCVVDTFRENTTQGTGSHILGFGIKENSVRYEGCRLSWFYDNDNNGYVFSLRPTTQGTNQPIKYELGTSSAKWSTINGLNPSALGMPDLSNGIDISSYITHLDKVVNNYTPPANGYIHIRVKKTSLPIVSIRIQQLYGLMTSSETADFSTWGTYLPVVAGKTVEFYISADSLASAIFYPCQGNV